MGCPVNYGCRTACSTFMWKCLWTGHPIVHATMSSRKPPLYSDHEIAGARFTTFGGWEMPVEFDSIRTEHTAVRQSVGKFDVSHMGEIRVTGPDATTLCSRLLTNDILGLARGQAIYSMITNEDGIILDDTIIYRAPEDESGYLFIPNAGHDEEMYDRWTDYRDDWSLDASISNETDAWAMYAVQGPEAAELVDGITDRDDGHPSDIKPFHHDLASISDVDCVLARTGYTGEDGFEILCPTTEAETVWRALECQPCGLGARDTLRLEAGFLLSGQDFHPDDFPRDPYQARAEFTVDLDHDFVGRDALASINDRGPDELFVGIRMIDRGIPRHGYSIEYEGKSVGTVTSGTMSPTLGDPIGLGYVPTEISGPGTEIAIDIRGSAKMASIETPGFLED